MTTSTVPQGPSSAPPASKWISFLRQYGPIPQSGNQYDEDIQRLARISRLEPISLPAPAIEVILEHLTAPNPRSVIITGTAGDGKTFHCREVWRRLGGAPDEWDRLEKIKQLRIGGRELCVIRDLSEFRPEDRDAEIPQMAADMLSPDSKRVYLVAANDGRLLEILKGASRSPAPAYLHAEVEAMLVEGLQVHQEFRLALINLSHQSAGAILPALVDAVTNHPGWEGCASCEHRGEPGNLRCPIWENRQRLRGDTDQGTLRQRLQHLMDLSEHNDIHFPVRQLLLLASNALLGHPDADHGLMTCQSVRGILEAGTEDRASIYRNILGENLTPRRRDKTAIFDTLGRFGIGSETSNRIDGIVVYGADDPELRPSFEELLLADSMYGGSRAFLAHQRAYLEGGNEEARTEFLTMLRSQRQRLFFTVPDAEVHRLPVWDLTVFRFAGDYLAIVEEMKAGTPLQHRWTLPLVRGLNRIFTGILVTNQDELLLASSGSHTQAKTSRLFEGQILVGQQYGQDVVLEFTNNRPFLAVYLAAGDPVGPVRLPLTLLRYEFLRRVADGALPSSFSLECYEDMLAFKANIMRAQEELRRAIVRPPDSGLVLRFLKVGDDGRAHQSPVQVHLS